MKSLPVFTKLTLSPYEFNRTALISFKNQCLKSERKTIERKALERRLAEDKIAWEKATTSSNI